MYKFKNSILKMALVSLTAFLIIFIGNVSVFAVDNESSAYMQYWTNLIFSNTYNVQMYDNGSWLATTYGNYGYKSEIIVDRYTCSLDGIKNGVTKTIVSGVKVTLNLSLVNNGRNVKIEYVVDNTSSSAHTVSIGSCADIKLGSNNTAPVTEFGDGSGFYTRNNFV